MAGRASDRIPSLAAQLTLGQKDHSRLNFSATIRGFRDIWNGMLKSGVCRIPESTRSEVESGNVVQQMFFTIVRSSNPAHFSARTTSLKI